MKDKANYMSPETFSEVIYSIPELEIRKWMDEDVEMLFKILYFCALRPMEGINLSKEDFDVMQREVFLGKTKTKKEDYAVIPKIFCTELDNYLSTKEPGRLLPDLTYATFYRWLKRLGIILDIPSWVVPQNQSGEKTVGHIFRKSVGKDMLNGKFGDDAKSIPVISKHMRHSKPSMTMDNYLKVVIEQVKESF
jgi:integrase